MGFVEDNEVLDELVGVNRKWPVGNKHALDNNRTFAALKRGAKGIAKLTEASNKRNKIAEQMLQAEK